MTIKIVVLVFSGIVALAVLFYEVYTIGVINGEIKQMQEDYKMLDKALLEANKELDRILGKK